MEKLEKLTNLIAHNSILIAAGATLSFGAKAITVYLTYRHYNRKLAELGKKLDRLLDSRSDPS